MKYGYRRVSSIDQNLDRQDLPPVDVIFEEKLSGASRKRPQLEELLCRLAEGDVVYVYSLDRLARNLRDLQDIVEEITGRGATVEFLSERLTFTGGTQEQNPVSTLMLQLLGSFAQFERSIIRKRQAEGIAKAKQRGVYKKDRSVDVKEIKELLDAGLTQAEVAKKLGVCRATVNRSLGAKCARSLTKRLPTSEAPSVA